MQKQIKPTIPIPQVVYANLKDSETPYQVESLCMNCQLNGTTTLLLTKIPFFKEVIIISFLCDHCGFRNNQVQFAGKLADYGVVILFRAMSKADLNRQVIKSQYAKMYFEELDFQIPVNGKAEINTIEGLLMRTRDELKFHQPLRKIHEPEQYQKLQLFLQRLQKYLIGQRFPLTIKITDPSGNAIIKNPFAPSTDKNMQISHFQRTLQQLIAMGFNKQNAEQQMKSLDTQRVGTKINFSKSFEENNFMEQQAVIFQLPCHSCQMPGQMRTCQTSVPYFAELIIMSFKCQYCGAHSTDTKTNGEIKENCVVITLQATGPIDLKRDLFKSQTCAVQLPDIDFQMDYGTLGGVFTTVQGLLQKIYDNLYTNNPFCDSDSEFAANMNACLQKVLQMRDGIKPFTMILIDPLSHSFISNPYLPDIDKNCKIEFRPRTFEESEDLGINDMKCENYGQTKPTK